MFLGLISIAMLAWAGYLLKNPDIVKVPTVLVNGTGTGYEGATAVLGASNLLATLKGLNAKPKRH